MNPDTLTEINALASLAQTALAKRETVIVLKLLKQIEHLTSVKHQKMMEEVAAIMAIADQLPDVGRVVAEMDGMTIEGTFTRGRVL